MAECQAAGRASGQVARVLQSLVAQTPEVGLQVAAYLDGKLVVDAWAGLADRAEGRPVDGDTLFMLSSSSKGVAATCMHICAERHGLSYDMPVAKVWPEFAAHGKGDATLRHALFHQTGVPQTPVGYTPDWLADWARMTAGIAKLEPLFKPGTRTAYHSTTFGFIIGEIVRRVDGRPIGHFLREEVAEPMGIDAYFGVPDSELSRVATLVDAPPAPAEHLARMVGEPAGCDVAAVFNQRAILQSPIPGSGGVFTARGIARHYAMLAGSGEIDGVRMLSPATMHEIASQECCEADALYRVRIRRGLGFRRGGDAGPGGSPSAFGHVGGGGSFAYADPERRLAIGFAKNYFVYRTAIATSGEAAPSTGDQVARAVYEALGL